MSQRLAITWQLSDVTGWGIFGLNLVYEIAKGKKLQPLLLLPPDIKNIDPLSKRLLEPFISEQKELFALFAAHSGKLAILSDVIILHHLTSSLELSEVSNNFEGEKNFGFVFFETSIFSKSILERAKKFDCIFAGSSWNNEVLIEKGLGNTEVLLQGVDVSKFYPLPNAKRLMLDRFVVFSGGKLEYRKGQDIVLAAFRNFYRRHPDALLVSMWHSPWPRAAETLKLSPHINNRPKLDEHGSQNIAEWASKNGVPERAFIDLGVVPNSNLANILRNVDISIFPNRCEGGTNLVAMECMAMGIPCVLSANTGHLDLISPDRCFILADQSPIQSPDGSTQYWGESSVEELVEVMEKIYSQPNEAKKIGVVGAGWIKNMSWQRQIEKLCMAVYSK